MSTGKILTLRVTEKEMALLKKASELDGMSVSDLIRHYGVNVIVQNLSKDYTIFKKDYLSNFKKGDLVKYSKDVKGYYDVTFENCGTYCGIKEDYLDL